MNTRREKETTIIYNERFYLRMKTISWITAYYFLDVDLPIIAKLKDEYIIHWQIIIGRSEKIDYENYVQMLIPETGSNLHITYVYEKYRHRNPRLFFTTRRIMKAAKSHKPAFYYISGFMDPWGVPLMKAMLPLEKVVVAWHNVSVPRGASRSLLGNWTRGLIKKHMINIQVFSKSQHAVLNTICSGKNVLEAPLALKDYGAASVKREDDDKKIVRFLNFGIIRDYKRLDLLIEAGELLYERGYRNYRILIAGSSNEWESRYAPMIKHTELFELQIRRIPNEEVPNLFAVSDYFVMPYQDIAQSGAITVAFQYNVPTIVSDIPPFEEFVEDGKTGLTFKSEDAKDLADKMQYVLDNHPKISIELRNNQAEFVRKELSIESIIERYKVYFNKL